MSTTPTTRLTPTTTSATPRIAILAGATGAVGTELCRQLRDDGRYHPVVVLSRRPPLISGAPLQVEQIDFAQLSQWTPKEEIDVVFCALGTTMAKAGSEAAFRAVDHDLVLEMARLAQRAHARHFVMVSSMGANPESRSFYLRTKGEAEASVIALGLPHCVIVRPSLIDAERSERRPAEQFARHVARFVRPLMQGPFARYAPNSPGSIAQVMREHVGGAREGVEIIEAEQIREWS